MSDEASKNFKLIGLWMSEKKFQKLRWTDLLEVCRSRGYDLVKLDVERPLEEQGKLCVFMHKLTDIIAAADQGDIKAQEIIGNVQQYISNHPDMAVIDPLDNVRVLLDRYRYYTLIENHPDLRKDGVFTPPFCTLVGSTLTSTNEKLHQMSQRGVTFPVVCKPTLAHGSKSAHSMCVIFNEAGLAQCRSPCVLQSFINHNAVLYKVFMVGNSYYITERPSLKNFYACNEREPIYFHSGDVCKADSQSTLSILDPHEVNNLDEKVNLDLDKVETIIRVLRKELQLILFGIDIVIDNVTNHYAIIDVNVYPGYEGYPDFFDHLVDSIDNLVKFTDQCLDTALANNVPEDNESVCKKRKGFAHNFDSQDLINVEHVMMRDRCRNSRHPLQNLEFCDG